MPTDTSTAALPIDLRSASGETVSLSLEAGRHGHQTVLVLRSVASDLRGGRRQGDVLAALPLELATVPVLSELLDADSVTAVLSEFVEA